MRLKEDLLHYIWKYKKFDTHNLHTDGGSPLQILKTGQVNLGSGPDFFNALIEIEHQKWAGNIEIHLRSSDWYLHRYETDSSYDNVILHVVWENDAQIFRKDHSTIPTLELKGIVPVELTDRYTELLNTPKQFINCEKDFAEVDELIKLHWFESLYFERLERKTLDITGLLNRLAQDWEAVLYILLFKYFGLKVNGDTFEHLAKELDFAIVRKNRSDLQSLEALFFGQAGLLEADCEDSYFLGLKEAYKYLVHKHQLQSNLWAKPHFFRLRPPNFPTIRLSQLAKLFTGRTHLFDSILEAKTMEDYYRLFRFPASEYWESHYTFGKISKNSKKTISKNFVDLLVINVVIPLRFAYLQSIGKTENDFLLKLIQTIEPEHNSITKNFDLLQKINSNALISQSLIQLKNEYCTPNKCLNCEIGAFLLKK